MTILLMGDINVDTSMNIHKYPALGGDAFADKIHTQPGGGVVNSAASLAGLGERVALLGATGEDLWAEMVLKPLLDLGVDCSSVFRLRGETTGLIFLPIVKGERTMFSYRGANQMLDPDWISPSMFTDVEILHISGYAYLERPQRDAVIKAVNLAKSVGIPITLDTALEPVVRFPEAFRALLPELAVCVLGMPEAEALVGGDSPDDCADRLLESGVAWLGLKLGCDGALIGTRQGRKHFPIFEVDTVDTTGAGDSFSSGLIYAYHHKLDIESAGTLASALGAVATTVYGGGLDLDWRPQLVDFLRSQMDATTFKDFNKGIEDLQKRFTA